MGSGRGREGEEIPGGVDGRGTEGAGVPGAGGAYKQTHARILLLSDENWGEGPLKDLEIAWVLQVGPPRWNGYVAGVWKRG